MKKDGFGNINDDEFDNEENEFDLEEDSLEQGDDLDFGFLVRMKLKAMNSRVMTSMMTKNIQKQAKTTLKAMIMMSTTKVMTKKMRMSKASKRWKLLFLKTKLIV